MGSAASFDTGLTTDYAGNNYFCHSCHRVIVIAESNSDRSCPQCHSTFLEELNEGRSNLEVVSLRHRTNGQLTLEQARRIANATAMLRLLETQLREELENLQRAFEAANAGYEGNRRVTSWTKTMKHHLRKIPLSLDVMCSQPSCPICSEDFVVGHEVTCLPCSHIFHAPCVIPWLEQKQNCPICRTDIPKTVPTVAELNKREVEEIIDSLREVNIEVPNSASKSKEELVELLYNKLGETLEKENLEHSQRVDIYHSRPIVNFTVRTFGLQSPSVAFSREDDQNEEIDR